MRLVIANLKMSRVNDYKVNKDIVICCNDIYLDYFKRHGYKTCSQNVSEYESFNHTGSTSIKMLKDLDTDYVLIGHYEVRRDFKDDEEKINKKLKLCLKNNLKPILCIGNNIGEDVEEYVLNELYLCLDGIDDDIIVVYEPIYSIGSGVTPSIQEIKSVIKIIKEAVPRARVLYGGSVSVKNINQLSDIQDLDGVIVGKDSLDVDKINYIREVF